MKAMARHRSHSIEFKRQVAQEFIAGETLHGLAARHGVSRNLIRAWVMKFEAGAFDECRSGRSASGIRGEDRRPRAHGGPAGARNRVSKGGVKKRTTAGKRDYIRHQRPQGLSAGEGCRLMGLPRSTFYDVPTAPVGDVELVAKIVVICDEFETYGYRRGRGPVLPPRVVVSC